MYEYNLGLKFEQVAAHNARRAALWFHPEETVSYQQLNELANQTARLLRERGVRAGDVVCLLGEKEPQTFACMIACLKLGAVYSIIDPDSPLARLRKILGTCEPKLLVGSAEFLERIATLTAELEIATEQTQALRDSARGFDSANVAETALVTGANPAYIMFTSGSTGFPKGALMTHANVLNLIEWSRETFNLTLDDVLTNVNPLYFDNSVFDFYSALFTGASLVPFSKTEVNDPGTLVRKVDAAGCTPRFSVPSLLIFLQTMKAADGKNLRSIRRFVFGGEGYPKAKLKGLFEAYSATSDLFNVYGPTECTCICSSYKLSARDFEDPQGLPPLGRIAPNFHFLILDDQNNLVRPGETGELCLLGPNVGKGYYNDPERTAARFIQNPLHDHFAELIYKTGDLARLNPADGLLYIQGRQDNQIKHMGYRIELEEIEAALNCLDYVSEAAVLHATVNGFSRIIAIVSSTEPFADRIRGDLKQIIPDYMVPSTFHEEAVLPKNANGKIDRRALAERYISAAAPKEVAALE